MTGMRAHAAILAVVIAMFPYSVLAQTADGSEESVAQGDAPSERGKPSLTVEPVLLDSEDTDQVTLGLEYVFALKAPLVDLSPSTSDDFDDIDNPGGRIELRIDSAGTIATSAARNPKNFISGTTGIDGTYFLGKVGWVSLGAQVKYETDQKFDKEQTVLGGRLTWLKSNLIARNDILALDLGYGRVDPSDEDTDRKTALGVAELEGFDRLDFEAWYHIPTGWGVVRALEFNYRLYHEIDAPSAVEAAGIDNFELATIRAKLPGDFFVAYSKGKLPFDKTSDQIVEVGLSYKFF